MLVRRASCDDARGMAALRRAWCEEQDGPVDDDEFEARFAEWVQGPGRDRMTWVAEEAQQLVGMLNVVLITRMPRPGRDSGRWGYVSHAFVLVEHRSAGVGTAPLDAALRQAKADGFVRLVLNPSERSVPFYRRAGFEVADMLLVRALEPADLRPGPFPSP